MTIGFFLASQSSDSSSIDVVVRHDGVRYKRALGASVKTSMWSKKSQRAKVTQDYKQGSEVNFAIQKYRSAIQRLIDNESCPNIINAKHFWALVDCELEGRDYQSADPTPKYFTDYFETTFIRRFRTAKSESRIKRFKASLSVIQRFEEQSDRRLTFAEINTSFYRELEAYFVKQHYSANYFGSIVKIVKQVMREAADVDNIHSNNEFRSANFKAVSSAADTVYLTDIELKRIHAMVIDEAFVNELYPNSDYSGRASYISSYNFTKNIFIIGAYTGLRLSDFTRLNAGHFAGDRLTMITEKTGQKVVIPVHPIVREILDRGFDFSQKLSEQKLRLYIKNICRMAKIDELVDVRRSSMSGIEVERIAKWKLIGTHTARRSFATNAYKAGVPTLAIMKITGHTKESTFMRYIRISQEENADILSTHPFFT